MDVSGIYLYITANNWFWIPVKTLEFNSALEFKGRWCKNLSIKKPWKKVVLHVVLKRATGSQGTDTLP